jgi:hypothetical protein
MLEDQLLLRVVFKQNRVLVERAYLARELDSADQIDRNRALVFADRIEKSILDILCRLGFHGADLLLLARCLENKVTPDPIRSRVPFGPDYEVQYEHDVAACLQYDHHTSNYNLTCFLQGQRASLKFACLLPAASRCAASFF